MGSESKPRVGAHQRLSILGMVYGGIHNTFTSASRKLLQQRDPHMPTQGDLDRIKAAQEKRDRRAARDQRNAQRGASR